MGKKKTKMAPILVVSMTNGSIADNSLQDCGEAKEGSYRLFTLPINLSLSMTTHIVFSGSNLNANCDSSSNSDPSDSLKKAKIKKDKAPVLPPVPHEVMRTVSERHNKGLMSPYIYQILSQVITMKVVLRNRVFGFSEARNSSVFQTFRNFSCENEFVLVSWGSSTWF